jgi:hypothetical protein
MRPRARARDAPQGWRAPQSARPRESRHRGASAYRCRGPLLPRGPVRSRKRCNSRRCRRREPRPAAEGGPTGCALLWKTVSGHCPGLRTPPKGEAVNITRTGAALCCAMALLAACPASAVAKNAALTSPAVGEAACATNAISSPSIGESLIGGLGFQFTTPAIYGSNGCPDQYIFNFSAPASFNNGIGGFGLLSAAAIQTQASCQGTTLTLGFYAYSNNLLQSKWILLSSQSKTGTWTDQPSGSLFPACSLYLDYMPLWDPSYTTYRVAVGGTRAYSWRAPWPRPRRTTTVPVTLAGPENAPR